MPAADDLDAAVLRAAGVEALHDPRRADGGNEVGAGDAVVDPFAVRPVGDERLPPAVEVVAPGVDEPADEDVQLHRLGPEPPDAAAVEALDAVRGLDVRVDVDGLVEPEAAVRAPAECVDDVVRVLGAE